MPNKITYLNLKPHNFLQSHSGKYFLSCLRQKRQIKRYIKVVPLNADKL